MLPNFPSPFLTSCSILQMSLYVDHFSRGGPFDLCPFSTFNRPCCVMERPKPGPTRAATPKSTSRSYRASAAILARLLRKSANSGGASTGGSVQRSSLPPRRVPGVNPFMDMMRYCFPLYLLCILDELASDAIQLRLGIGVELTEEVKGEMSAIDDWRHWGKIVIVV